jgi:predicted CoA-substrate-specific enzyme activase
MEDRHIKDLGSLAGGRQHNIVPLARRGKLSIGIDIGSTSSDIIVLDDGNKIIFEEYKRTLGWPMETVREQLERILAGANPADVELVAATGSAGRMFSQLMNVPFANEVQAQAAAIAFLYPQEKQATVIDMGGQDTKLIFLLRTDKTARISDFALNTVCAAGTGSFLDQQAQRLGVNIEGEFGALALQSRTVPRMAGRCSVFAKSDMIHLQQQATPVCDIVAGLCLALARNLKSNLGCGREFLRPIVFTGGVAANAGVVRALEDVFELGRGGLIVPEKHFFTGALGAVLVARGKADSKGNGGIKLEKMDEYLSGRGGGLEGAPRKARLQKPTLPEPENVIYDRLLLSGEPVEAYLGLDVGSISTKVAVIDKQKRLLAKTYIMTAGRPLEAVQQVLDIVGRQVAGRVKILGAATTGSGRYLTGDFIGADLVVNEITAQAAGAAIINPEVDTIFEIGGQDSKYISIENGVVVDFEMNHACAAGTGSFLEEQATRLGINIKEEFARKAFESESPIKLGERCTVFMESDLISFLQRGAKNEDLVAGLSYSIVTNYLNRVVGRRRIGQHICFQGGTAFNKAVWSAFEEVTGRPVMVPDHHEVTGAIGAAAIVSEHLGGGAAEKSRFRGFENLVNVKYTVESFSCEHCPNGCEIKKVQLPGSEPLYYGSRCDRYNLKKKGPVKKEFDAFEYRQKKMFEFAGLEGFSSGATKSAGVKTVGIPMALVGWQLLPLFARFFKELGMQPVLSGKTSKRIIRKGVETVTAQTCYPVKVAFGHIAELIEKGVDYIFLPSIVSMPAGFAENEYNQLCPYVQSFAYQVKSAFGDRLGGTEILTTPLRLGEGEKLLRKTFGGLGKKLGVSRSAVVKALGAAQKAQAGFERAIREKGEEILDKLRPDERLFVLVSRPYNGCDEEVNLRLPEKIAGLGVRMIPVDMLDLGKARLGDVGLHKAMFWSYGQKILRAAELIKRDERLFGIYLSNFSCGPDSFLMTFFKDIMGKKPCLQLEIDEHSADAGVITRLEAFLDSLKYYSPRCDDARRASDTSRQVARVAAGKSDGRRTVPAEVKDARQTSNRKRTWYIPYMGDNSYGLAACLRGYGQPAEVMPLADERTMIEGRAFTTGKECLPCAITTGDMLKIVKSAGFDGNGAAFFMPGACGPCRFGMYNCLHKLVLRQVGCADVPVITPNQDSRFYNDFCEALDVSKTAFLRDVWVAVVGIDLLHKLILRLRPFAKDRFEAQRIYDKSLQRWVEAVEKREKLSDFCQLAESIADDFSILELDTTQAKPKVGIVGEIYVRSHPFANDNLIIRLEQLGAVCELAPLAEWIYYTNFTRAEQAGRRGDWRDIFVNKTQNFYQHRIERKLARPLEKRFGRLAEGDVEEAIEMAEPYIHQSFEGEAILSVGKMVEYYHQGCGGVVNVMPFTCMPSTIVSMQTKRISADCDGMPILNLSFDGQEDPSLTTRLEAFVEQVRQQQAGCVSIEELTTA